MDDGLKNILITVGCVALLILAACGAFIPEDYVAIYEITLGVILLPLGVFLFFRNRCPNCDSLLLPRRIFGFVRYDDCCPRCGADLRGEQEEAYGGYERLNYLQGELEVFEEYAETVLLVTYKDGMLIHVGYDEPEHEYVITVLNDGSDAAKETPLAVQRVFGRNKLLETLQETVHTWRDDKVEY